MLNDLDRRYRMDIPNAYPIAYAMKGPSLPCSSFRSMVEEVIAACRRHGLHVLPISTDGQWGRFGVRDENETPLTLVQLAKDVWKEANADKRTLTKWLKCCNKIDSKAILDGEEDIMNVIAIERVGNKLYTNSLLNPGKIPKMSAKISRLGSKKSQSKKACEPREDPGQQRSEPDDLCQILQELIISDEAAVIIEDIAASSVNQDDEETAEVVPESNAPEYPIPDALPLDQPPVFGDREYIMMKTALSNHDKWKNMSLSAFKELFVSPETVAQYFLKDDLKVCMQAMSGLLKREGFDSRVSVAKYRMVAILSSVVSGCRGDFSEQPTTRKIRKKNTAYPWGIVRTSNCSEV